MKRLIVYFAALAAVAVLFTGCGGMDNVSNNPNGIIESSSQATDASDRVTMPTESSRREGRGSTTEETGMNGTEESTESAPAARGRRPRRF